jgi:hypothetical protein
MSQASLKLSGGRLSSRTWPGINWIASCKRLTKVLLIPVAGTRLPALSQRANPIEVRHECEGS